MTASRLLGSVVGALLACAAVRGQTPGKFEGKCGDAACHGEYAKRAVVHQPVAGDSCDACHEPKPGEEHKFKLIKDGAALCNECHDEFKGKTVHDPAAKGQCTVCHDPHGSATQHLLTAKSVAAQCTECHDSVTTNRPFLHGPVAAGECTICHAAHASDHAKLLLDEGTKGCTKCHATVLDPKVPAAKVHKPVEDGCTACHDPHGAKNKMMLTAEAPGLCGDCHDDIAKRAAESIAKHSPVTTGAACLSCHEPHASAHKGMLHKAAVDVCLSCHNQEIAGAGGKVADIAGYLKANAKHHGPIDKGECAACHEPHGSANAGLLAGAYPARFYAPFDEKQYTLCFECHEARAFTENETGDATGFRDGLRNLHFVHVNQKTKGRTCRACHDAHAARNEKLIVERVPFGEWKIPLNFKLTPSGGGCQPGCHKPYAYDRERPVLRSPGG